jgi:uncharacterized protein YutE (UPF0331/DUF86 family)
MIDQIHEYADLDLTILHDVLQHRLGDFMTFSQHIEQYLKKCTTG